MKNNLAKLVQRWREEATLLARRGQREASEMATSYADELDRVLTELELEQLSVKVAAEESGYSESQLRRLFPGAETIARKNLPKKARHEGPDLAGEVLKRRRGHAA